MLSMVFGQIVKLCRHYPRIIRLRKSLQENLFLKIKKFQSNLEILTKLKNRIESTLMFLVMKSRKNHVFQSMF